MLIKLPPSGEMTTEVHSETCRFHRRHPGVNYPGCTCSSSYTYRRKTKAEKEADKEIAKRTKQFETEIDPAIFDEYWP